MKTEECEGISQRIGSAATEGVDIVTNRQRASARSPSDKDACKRTECEPKDDEGHGLKSKNDLVSSMFENQLKEDCKERTTSGPLFENSSRTCHMYRSNELTENETQRTAESNSGYASVRALKKSTEFVLNRGIKNYLEDLDQDELTKYLIPDKVLVRYGRLMDIVTSGDERTMCFTKG